MQDELPTQDGSMRFVSRLIEKAIPDNDHNYENRYVSEEEIEDNIDFIERSMLPELFCAASDNFEIEKLRKYIKDRNYNYLKRVYG